MRTIIDGVMETFEVVADGVVEQVGVARQMEQNKT
jgi:hypothetical protein